MPRFTSLSQAVRFYVREFAPTLQVAQGTILSVQMGQNIPQALGSELESGVQRWGFSTWGIEPITGVYSPDDEPKPVSQTE